ncbi:enoyl-[acyl-carrier protein] reductase I [Chitinophaga sp. YR627]|uniref:SDR family NAD(P)-dependent oxidoreductase n=1 Tax=Chitinophaga sp. YR627 TaxID=1881041 RepID=UPI0008E4F85B|nr:SDR family oxidoreductase [Chitinophaga sp. YR627]SFM66136.1 enoyl-[acyl-carrier protein] reductase I [Chitinophaga sp. YR627]
MVKEFLAHRYWALILGGSNGLGLATAHKLAQHGMHICIVHRDPRVDMERINREFEAIRTNGVEVLSFNADALQAEKRNDVIQALKAAMGREGRIRTLVHSIAKGNLKAMYNTDNAVLSTDDFRITLDSMAISLYDWSQALIQQQLFAADARILSFTSEGSSRAWAHYAAVAAAKAALEAITRNMALEFASLGIRANCIQAGVTDTRSLQAIPGSEALIAYTKQRNPFHRLTSPEDVANAVYLLCKDEAAWINGAVIPVNGGEHIS